jgi:hypothetical protein
MRVIAYVNIKTDTIATQPPGWSAAPATEARTTFALLNRVVNRKVTDQYTVPVCRLHHRELHQYGVEASWWATVNTDPFLIALELWRARGPRSYRKLGL